MAATERHYDHENREVIRASRAGFSAHKPPSVTAALPAPSRDTAPLRYDASQAPIVVTGSSPAAPLTDVLDRRTVRLPMPSSDGSDYLQAVPGFSAVRNGGANSDPVLRGQFGSRLTILANGATLAGACGGRMDPTTAYLSPESYDHIVITKGPHSVLWGPMAAAGTLRFERETTPFDIPGIRWQGTMQAGSRGRVDPQVDVAIGSPRADVRVTARHAFADDYRDGDGHTVPSAWRKWEVDTTLGWYPAPHTRLAVDLGVGDGHARYAGSMKDGVRFRRDSIMLRLKHRRPAERLDEVDARLYLNRLDHRMDNYTLRALSAPRRSVSNVARETLGGRLALQWTLSPNAQWISGIDGESQQHYSHMASSATNRSPDLHGQPWKHQSDRLRWGAFAESQHTLGERDTVIAGLRLDYTVVHDYRSRTPNHASLPRRRHAWLPGAFARFEHALSESTQVYAALGHTARFPDHWELYAANGGANYGSTAFAAARPERSTQIDIGTRYEHADRSAWIASYFSYVDDYLLFDYRQPNRAVIRNVRAQLFGGEAGLDWPLGAGWHTGLSVASAWGNNLSNRSPLPQMPPLDARLSLRYASAQTSVGLLWRAVAPQHRYAPAQGSASGRGDRRRPSAGFGTVAWHASHALSKRTSLHAGIDNLFNKTYAEHLNRSGNASLGYPAETPFQQPGRTGWVKVKVMMD